MADNNQRKNIPLNSKTELRDVYLDVAKLAVQCSEKSEQEIVWAFLTYHLGKDIQNPQARRWLDLVYEARKMWLANVSFQNAMEYLVLS